ncbi:MAG: cupin domain-containing protein [Candidatus Dormibacteria bacterium]
MAAVSRQAVRRVVTGVDATGKSVVVMDGNCECQAVEDQYVSVDLWAFRLPAPTQGSVDVPSVADIDPAPSEVIWRRFTLGPGERIDFHSTETVDLMSVESGEITLVLEVGEPVKLRPGDCVVQRGTRHGWVNDGPDPCVLLGVMASTVGP